MNQLLDKEVVVAKKTFSKRRFHKRKPNKVSLTFVILAVLFFALIIVWAVQGQIDESFPVIGRAVSHF